MKRFTELYLALDRTTSTNAKIDAMAAYFETAPPEDAAWAVFFLGGQRFKRLMGWKALRETAIAASGVPEWLFDDCYSTVGDLAETIALLVPGESTGAALALHEQVAKIVALRKLEDEKRRETLRAWWAGMDARERYVMNKLVTGAMRVGVSRTLVIRALAKASDLDRNVIQHRLTGTWKPSKEAFVDLLRPDDGKAKLSQPYPFYLASQLEVPPAKLGELAQWQVEWKWDGIRAQLLRREGATFVWSRGEELITERFPEVVARAEAIPPGHVLDGELLCWNHAEDKPLPFAIMQKRTNRKKLGKKILTEAPAYFVAYDLLEIGGKDARGRPQSERRAALEKLVAPLDRKYFRCSPLVEAKSWLELAKLRETSRSRGVEGFMLKLKSGAYRTGRRKGEWWKWKVDPLTLDCVLIYAQAGTGQRAGLFTDYTFAIWNDDEKLTPIARAYSGLDDEEMRELDKWIRRNTLERFGPVRAVSPTHVFELAFEGIRESTRHKSGIAVRFPRIARWRRDKKPADADTIETVRDLLATVGG